MFEETLAYWPENALNRPFSELLALAAELDLEDDAGRFYARMASDIAIVSALAGRPALAAAIGRTLLEALKIVPPARAAAWRRLYRSISGLAAGCPGEAAPENARGERFTALGRLRQFLRENRDLDSSPIEDPARTARGRVMAGA
jgi:hypothetical protein